MGRRSGWSAQRDNCAQVCCDVVCDGALEHTSVSDIDTSMRMSALTGLSCERCRKCSVCEVSTYCVRRSYLCRRS